MKSFLEISRATHEDTALAIDLGRADILALMNLSRPIQSTDVQIITRTGRSATVPLSISQYRKSQRVTSQ